MTFLVYNLINRTRLVKFMVGSTKNPHADNQSLGEDPRPPQLKVPTQDCV